MAQSRPHRTLILVKVSKGSILVVLEEKSKKQDIFSDRQNNMSATIPVILAA